MSGVEIIDLGLIERDLRMARFVVDLHRLDVWGGDLAKRALKFGVATLLLARTIGKPRLPPAAIGGGGVDFGGNLLRRVLLGLRFSSHGDQWQSLSPIFPQTLKRENYLGQSGI